jgi:hypothetical protein
VVPLLQHPSFTNVLSKLLQIQSKINILLTGMNLVLFHAIGEAKPGYFQVRPIGVLGSWVRLAPPPPMRVRKDNEVMFTDYASLCFQNAKSKNRRGNASCFGMVFLLRFKSRHEEGDL